MRNKYPGACYRCGGHVEAGAGHFERHRGGWRLQHATCAIQHREIKNAALRRLEVDKKRKEAVRARYHGKT